MPTRFHSIIVEAARDQSSRVTHTQACAYAHVDIYFITSSLPLLKPHKLGTIHSVHFHNPE